MTLAARTQALLDVVERDRAARCEAILAEARAAADALLAQARERARHRVHEAFAEERMRARSALAAARADLHTRRRLHEQRRVESLLALGWQRLPDVLKARWSDAAARARWVEHACASAAALLPQGPWHIAHGAGWPDAERVALATRLQCELGAAPRIEPAEHIDAGLRIAAAGNVVDATLAGLLADREEIGSRLVGLLEEPVEGPVESAAEGPAGRLAATEPSP